MKPEDYSKISDLELIDHYNRTGDSAWLGVMLQRYTLLLFGVCMKYLKNEEEAKDCVQQIFLKALTELPKYRVEFVKSWLYTIARNLCLMKLRDKGKQPVEISEKLVMPDTGEEENPKLLQLLREKQYDLLDKALEALPEEQQTCIRLFFLDRKTYQQISEMTGYSYMQVKSFIQNGKRNLKILLQKGPGSNS